MKAVVGTSNSTIAGSLTFSRNFDSAATCLVSGTNQDCNMAATRVQTRAGSSSSYAYSSLVSIEDKNSQCKDGSAANPEDCLVRITVYSSNPDYRDTKKNLPGGTTVSDDQWQLDRQTTGRFHGWERVGIAGTVTGIRSPSMFDFVESPAVSFIDAATGAKTVVRAHKSVS